jgi:uncharacterized membrane protein YhaH (DUF805 family)
MNYDALFVNPVGRTTRGDYVPALLTVVAAIAFFGYFVGGRTAQFCMLVLLYPAFVLLARRLQDIGVSGWLVLLPLAPTKASFGIVLGYLTLGSTMDAAMPWVAAAVVAAFALWGAVSQGKT